MGLFQRLIYGVDLDAEQAKSDAADARLLELNRQAEERGVWTPEQRAASDARIASQAPVSDQVDAEFQAGWSEGAANVSGGVAKVVSGVTGTAADVVTAPLAGLLRGLPWWLWIAGGVALLAWSGQLPRVITGLRSSFDKK